MRKFPATGGVGVTAGDSGYLVTVFADCSSVAVHSTTFYMHWFNLNVLPWAFVMR